MRKMSILSMTDEQFRLWELTGLMPDTHDDEEDEAPSRRRRR
tara:strand:+ start:70 stop:195 length:126 start_codon:yes stop_codon:yes gene_type:complete